MAAKVPRQYRQTVSLPMLENALRRAHGVVTTAAALIELEVGHVYTREACDKRVRRSLRLQRVRAECEERILDLAEKGLHHLVADHDGPTIRWLLGLKGRARGYRAELPIGPDGERASITQNVFVYMPDNGRDPDFAHVIEHAPADLPALGPPSDLDAALALAERATIRPPAEPTEPHAAIDPADIFDDIANDNDVSER
jgi:hypothetical protein